MNNIMLQQAKKDAKLINAKVIGKRINNEANFLEQLRKIVFSSSSSYYLKLEFDSILSNRLAYLAKLSGTLVSNIKY